MQLILNIPNAFVLFCGGLVLISGIGQLVVRQRSKLNYVLAAFLVCIASLQIRGGLLLAGYLEMYPCLSIFSYTFAYAIGPLLYYYYILFFKSPLKNGRVMWLHFLIPAMLFIAEMIIYLLIPLDMKRYIIHGLIENKSHPMIIYIRLCLIGAGLNIICYLTAVLKDLIDLYGFRELKGIHLSIFVVVAFSMICPLIYIVGLFIGCIECLKIGFFIFCLLEIFMYLVAQRYPKFLNIIKKDIHTKRYEKTRLHNFDADAVNNRLLELMEEDRLYNDENISLGNLSERLKITPHQLSEYLNRYRNVSFHTLINTYRIEEAKKLLLEDTDLTILQIAYSVGFKSKSVFNSAFQKFTGMTPQNFRKSKNQ